MGSGLQALTDKACGVLNEAGMGGRHAMKMMNV
jgi:hypothetical protein